mgnify:CR=1 FL=1
MPKTFIDAALPARPHPSANYPVTPIVRAHAEFLIGAWALRAYSHVDVNRGLTELMTSGDPSVRAGNPFMLLWTPAQRTAWLGEARHDLFGQGQLLDFRILGIRLFLARQHTKRSIVMRTFGRAGFGKADAELYLALMADKTVRANFEAYLKPLRDPLVAADLTLCPERIRKEMAEDVVRFKLRQAAMAKVSARKLNFVAKSNLGVTLADLATDALLRGLAYYMRARPTYSRLHAANMAKSAMDGAVHALLEYWTNPDRARMEATPDGWTVKITSFDEMPGFEATTSITMQESDAEDDHDEEELAA